MKRERNCACDGRTLDRLLQPAVMAWLVEGPIHGYALVEKLKDSPLMQGCTPDRMGVYRLLTRLEDQGMVRHAWSDSNEGPSKRLYELTPAGQQCLKKWIETLERYQQDIGSLVAIMRKAATAAPN